MRPEKDCEAVPRTGTIGISDPAERSRWAKAFNVSEAVLVQAVRIVGTSVIDLRKLFCREK